MPSDFQEDAFRSALLHGLAVLARQTWTLTTDAGDVPASCSVYEEEGEAGLEFGDASSTVRSDCEVSGFILRCGELEYSSPLAPVSLPSGANLIVSPGRVFRVAIPGGNTGTRTANE